MNAEDLPYLSTTALATLIERKEVSPLEATVAYLERIDALDLEFNAYLTLCRQEALAAAREAEQAILKGTYLGPMHGIPVAVKDQIRTKGIRSTCGARFLMDFVPDEDATVVARLKEAGAIILGKTSLTEFGITAYCHRYRTPRNPWDLSRSTGGSSSGSAAATAAFLCSTSLGEDTGGSILWPASWCGLVGVRPSWGRVSRRGVVRGVWSMDAVGPISRTVEDAAITLGAIAGHDPKDSRSSRTPVPDYRRDLDGRVRGVRIGVLPDMLALDVVEPEVRDAVTSAARSLSALGAEVEEVTLPLAKHGTTITSVLQDVEDALDHAARLRQERDGYGHDNRIMLLTGSLVPAHYYEKGQRLRSLLRQQVVAALERYDVLLLPATGRPAQVAPEDTTVTSKEAASLIPFLLTGIFNHTGGPSLSVPCGLRSEGMPIGLQLGGRPYEEGTVLKVAHAYEQSTQWHTKRPPSA